MKYRCCFEFDHDPRLKQIHREWCDETLYHAHHALAFHLRRVWKTMVIEFFKLIRKAHNSKMCD